jgi:hypothetical protein
VTDNQWLIGIIEHPFDNARCIRFRQTAHHLPKREPRPSLSRGGVREPSQGVWEEIPLGKTPSAR